MPHQVEGYSDIVVTPHVLATQAGMNILTLGGNATDAAIAANAVQGVVAPETCGIGGDLFALIWTGESPPSALNASGPAGSGVSAERLRAEGIRELEPLHPDTVTVPGCVRGWEEMHRRFGRADWETILGPAIRLAESGFPASQELADAFAARFDALSNQSAVKDLYPDGRPPMPGVRLQRTQLAATLKAIARHGPDFFYMSEPARMIAEATSQRITTEDLERFQPEWVTPLGLRVFGQQAWTIPPNSQGYLTLGTCWIFENLVSNLDPGSPEWHHLLIEAYRSIAWERESILADPASSPGNGLLADLSARARLVSPDRAGDYSAPSPGRGGTAYLAVLDSDGMGVSLIQSNFWGIGSNVGVDGCGFCLHNRGYGFTLEPGHPNELAPGRRPAHTLSPTVWEAEGRLSALLGTRGGDQQPQLLSQMAANLFLVGDSPAIAQHRPRWALDDLGRSRNVKVESGMPEAVTRGLSSRGHIVEEVEPLERGWGPVSVIAVDTDGVRTGAADPRVVTASAAVS